MRSYDVKCNSCGHEDEQFIGDKEEFEPCSQCGGEVRRIFSKMTFKLIDNPKTQMVGWSHNSYAHNCYWDEFKEKRYNQKMDVIPPDADPD